MINVNVTTKENKIIEMNVSGHALFAQAGQDIVCAGVSSIMTGLLNALDLKTNYNCWIEENSMHIKTDQVSDIGQIICETGLIQLLTVQEQFPENIQIQEVKL